MVCGLSRILIVGMGSIGKRYISIISELYPEISIALLRHQKCSDQFSMTGVDYCVSSIDDALEFKPHAAIIANPASHHLDTAIPLANAGVHLLIEKPISITSEGLDKLINICSDNDVTLMTGYNLRFLPSLQAFRGYLNEKKVGKVLSVRAEVGQYLPNWRVDSDYRNTVSAQKILGGGVLLELSHEIDYLQWLFGRVNKIEYTKIKKISNLKIKSEDIAQVIGKIKNINFYLNLTYFSKFEERRIIIDSKKETIIGDLINCNIKIINNNNLKIIKLKNNINQTYVDQHLSILNNQSKNLCNIKDAKNTVSFIEKLKKKI